MDRYKVVRRFFDDNIRKRTIHRGLTLEEARRHCSDPETSSRTCKGAAAVRRTRRYGAWFDGYELE